MEISTLISTLAGAKQLGGALLGERDRQKAAAIQTHLTEKIAQAQLQLLEVVGAFTAHIEETRVIRERLGQLEASQREHHRYELAEVAPGRGGFAYRLRPAAELTERQNEPPHFLCQPCFDAGVKRVLQRSPDKRLLFCPGNPAHTLRTEDAPAPNPIRRTSRPTTPGTW